MMDKVLCHLVFAMMAISLLTQCRSSSCTVPVSAITEIKKNYSATAINYFYETAFFEDYVGEKGSLLKWKNDIYIRLEGTNWPNDSLYVREAINQINSLNLPIRLYLTSNTKRANLFVYFGDFEYLKEKLEIVDFIPFLGIGKVIESSSSISSAKIGIANNASSYAALTQEERAIMRKSIIAEEITQCLGPGGDSWMYYNSIFFEGKKRITNLQEIDKEIIKLMYEPAIPARLSKEKFETYFKDILYHIDGKNKLVTYTRKNRVPFRYLKYIRNNGFVDSMLLKYPKYVFVNLEGDHSQNDLEFCKKAVALFNTVSKQLRLEIVQNDLWHDVPSITIEYNDSTGLNSPITERFMQPGAMMFTRRVRGRIKVSYENGLASQKDKNTLLFSAIYKMLGLNCPNDILEIDTSNQLKFKPGYKEMLSLFYNPVLPNGFSQQNLNEVVIALD